MTQTQIEEKAVEILKEYEMDGLIPFDPVRLANMLGIEVKNARFKQCGTAGLISTSYKKTTIYINADDSPNRKRFAIAHELGHYFLHIEDKAQGDIKVDMWRDINRAKDEREKEANTFAAYLLMDEGCIRSLWNELKSVKRMIDIFKVSAADMSYRLMKLRLI